MSLPRRLAFVDVETTGAHPVRDRITEVAVLRVEDGEIVARWESLVNPQRAIPALIQNITGIDDRMVADAPSFDTLADHIAALLEGCVFVAHNARFDLGFIRNAFARCAREFDAPVLCTVKLSRALYPQHYRHGLDALIARHALECSSRHRAMGDAQALWQFVRQAEAAFEPEVLARAVQRAMSSAPRPSGLPIGVLEAVPDGPGVYLCYGDEPGAVPAGGERPLFIGRSNAMRSRLGEHFHSRAGVGKDAELQRATRRLEWIETAGELGSQLLELDLRRRLRPTMGRAAEAPDGAFAIRLNPNRRRAPIYQRVPIAGSDPAAWEGLRGLFRNRSEADKLLRQLAEVYRLCPRRLGLEGGSGECSARAKGRCAGVCAGRETAAEHDRRLAAALEPLGLPRWPWPAAVIVCEHHEASGREAFHLLDRWCWLGSAASRAELAALAGTAVRAFDLDVWRLLERWFAAAGRQAGRTQGRSDARIEICDEAGRETDPGA